MAIVIYGLPIYVDRKVGLTVLLEAENSGMQILLMELLH